MRQIAVSDIHGCIRTLETLLFRRIRVTPEDRLFFLGDYIDRGPGSREVLDLLIRLKSEYPQTVILRGNHEQLMLKGGKDEWHFYEWMINGSFPTLKSFGIEEPYTHHSWNEIPDKYMEFIRSMDYFHLYKRIILSHAGLDTSRKNPLKHRKAMLWITRIPDNPSFLQGRKIIHGHRCYPLKQIRKAIADESQWQYSIDSGCVYNYKGMGFLSALNLDTMEMMSVKRIDEVGTAALSAGD